MIELVLITGKPRAIIVDIRLTDGTQRFQSDDARHEKKKLFFCG